MKEFDREDEIQLKNFFWVVYKRRWTVAAFLTVVVAVVAVYTFTTVPVYRATTQILIEKENPNIVDFKELYAVDATTQGFYQTQYKILQSRFLAKKVLDRMNLKASEFGSAAKEGERKETEGTETDEEAVIGGFLGSLEIEPVPNTRLAKIHFESTDPEMAARAANTVVDTYIEHNLEDRLEAIHGATRFLDKKIKEQRERLEESELLLQKYKEEYGIISLKKRENITVSKLAELNSDVLKAENVRVEAETRYRQAKAIQNKPHMIESLPKVVSNPFITSLKGDEANLSKKLSELSKKYGEKHPRIITLKEKLRTTRNKLNAETKKIINFFKNEYEVALAKEQILKEALEKLKDEAQVVSKHAIAYNVLLRNVEANKQMYEILLTRLKETGVTGGIQSTIVRVVDRAVVPRHPVRPRKKRNILLSIIMGLIGGIGVAFSLEYLDNTVKAPDDLKRYIRIPYLGPIPSFKTELRANPEEKVLVSLNHPKSTAAEAYRGVRTAIVFSSPVTDKKTLLVTSSNQSEGKSITVSNLAVTMGQSGSKTVLVDTDFRKPRIHKIFGLPKETGFSNLLVGAAELEDVVKKTDIPDLDVITCGHIPPNPSELLGSENMKKVIGLLKDRYDKILFDSPPVLPVTDSVILSTIVDEVLLVILAGKTSRELISRAVEQLKDVSANLLGAVINNIKVGQESYYQYHYYYYGDEESKRKPH